MIAPPRLGDTFGMHIRLSALRIDVPDPEEGQSQPLRFTQLKKISLVLPFSSEVHILDASRRMLSAAFSIRDSLNRGILIVYDWETEEAAMFDTGIPYVSISVVIRSIIHTNTRIFSNTVVP